MAVDLSYPGVYVKEDPTPILSVTSGATAVPAFVSASDHAGTGKFTTFPRRIDSWLDVVKAGVTGKTIGIALRAYFENGGGYCYVIETDEIDKVTELADVTLLVEAGAGAATDIAGACNEKTGIFGILDVDINTDGAGTAPASSEYCAAYGPYLKRKGDSVNTPPSAVVAGVYCTVDRERGVWKSPANVALRGGLEVTVKVSDTQQGVLNKVGDNGAVNVIRSFGEGAPIVWGARTLKGKEDKWRYVSVRRLFSAMEKDIKRAMGFAVFEPNSAPTWERVRAAIDSYLYALWKEGGLMGAKPEEAYSVMIGKDITMTEEQIRAGQMILRIGVAASRPAEFIVLEFSQEVGVGGA